ncbi:MAG: hypothetical protein LBI03_01735, partial [Clostridiales bacterium]|nr:hypothetical protein [Clostridiales bacterium]
MAKNEFKKAIKTYAELEKTRKQNLKEYVQMFELVSGAKDMEPLKRGLGLIKGRKRKRKEAVQTNAERQKQFRERRKAEGCIRKETWEKLNPDLGYEYVKVNVHQSSFDSCKNILWDFPGLLEQLREKVGQGHFPMDIYQNIIE